MVTLNEYLLAVLSTDGAATTDELRRSVAEQRPEDAKKVYGRLRTLERRQLVGRLKAENVTRHVLWYARRYGDPGAR